MHPSKIRNKIKAAIARLVLWQYQVQSKKFWKIPTCNAPQGGLEARARIFQSCKRTLRKTAPRSDADVCRRHKNGAAAKAYH